MFTLFHNRVSGRGAIQKNRNNKDDLIASTVRKGNGVVRNRVGVEAEARAHGAGHHIQTAGRDDDDYIRRRNAGSLTAHRPQQSADRLASHQVTLSDASEGEDSAMVTPAHPERWGAAANEGASPCQSTPRATATNHSPVRLGRPSPATALTNQVVSAARRRARQSVPPANSDAAAFHNAEPARCGADAVIAEAGLSDWPAAGRQRGSGLPGQVVVRSSQRQRRGQRGGRAGGAGGSVQGRSTVSWAPVLLMATAVVAAAALVLYPATLMKAASGGLRHVVLAARGAAVPAGGGRQPTIGTASAGSWVPAAGLSGGGGSGGGGGAASAAARGTWLLQHAMPYMAGAAWLVGGGSRTLSAARRSSAAVTGITATGGVALQARGWVTTTRAADDRGLSVQAGDAHRLPSVAAAATSGSGVGQPGAGDPGADQEWRESATVRVITITSGADSPYRTTWDELAAHSAQRLEWLDPGYQMLVFREEQLGADQGQEAFLRALQGGAHMVLGFDVTNPGAEAFLKDPRVASKLPGVALFVGGSERLSNELNQLPGGLRPQDAGSWRTALARKLTWTPDGRSLTVWDTVQLLLGRHDSDNFLFLYLVLVNQYVTSVPQVADSTKGFDLSSLICMIKNCGSKVVGCVQDLTCKSALDCLNSCSFNDQVCQYRCIVSYESPLLEQFSLCILQLHNCRNLDAKPPRLPDPAPMTAFRDTPLTHEAAEDLFIGWLDQPAQGAPAGAHLGDRPGKRYSWLVAGGKNPAYDYFPCQHQLYYRGKGRGQVWYEPIFKVITLDGREVWRRRVYRVRRGKVPGTFYLSVLDNGVTSNEFWRILDCDDDLAYCLFYYSGAASAAGLSYSGAVLGTPDGRMPGPQHTERLHAALRRAGIEPWELSYVNNSDCASAPLQITGPVPPLTAAA